MQPWVGIAVAARDQHGRLVWANENARRLLRIPSDVPDSRLPATPEFHVSRCLIDWDSRRYEDLWNRVWREGPIRHAVTLRRPSLEVDVLVQRGVDRPDRRSLHIFVMNVGSQAAEARQVREAIKTLTRRESQIARLVAKGQSTVAIATRLRISARTVDSHRAQIKRKLGVPPNSTQLARLLGAGSEPVDR